MTTDTPARALAMTYEGMERIRGLSADAFAAFRTLHEQLVTVREVRNNAESRGAQLAAMALAVISTIALGTWVVMMILSSAPLPVTDGSLAVPVPSAEPQLSLGAFMLFVVGGLVALVAFLTGIDRLGRALGRRWYRRRITDAERAVAVDAYAPRIRDEALACIAAIDPELALPARA